MLLLAVPLALFMWGWDVREGGCQESRLRLRSARWRGSRLRSLAWRSLSSSGLAACISVAIAILLPCSDSRRSRFLSRRTRSRPLLQGEEVIFSCEDPVVCWESACRFPPWLLVGMGGRPLITYSSVCNKVMSPCTVGGGGGGGGGEHGGGSADGGGGGVGGRDLLEPRWSARRPILGDRTGGGLLRTCWCCWDCAADGSGWWGKLKAKTWVILLLQHINILWSSSFTSEIISKYLRNICSQLHTSDNSAYYW
jgi:hypothetical protein